MQRLVLFLTLLVTWGLVAGGSRERTRDEATAPAVHALDGGTGGPPPSFP